MTRRHMLHFSQELLQVLIILMQRMPDFSPPQPLTLKAHTAGVATFEGHASRASQRLLTS